MLKIVDDPAKPNPAGGSMLDEIVRDGARQMLAAALLAEVAALSMLAAVRWTTRVGGWWSQWVPRAAGGDGGGGCGAGADRGSTTSALTR